jgi:hypothetical protein
VWRMGCESKKNDVFAKNIHKNNGDIKIMLIFAVS